MVKYVQTSSFSSSSYGIGGGGGGARGGGGSVNGQRLVKMIIFLDKRFLTGNLHSQWILMYLFEVLLSMYAFSAGGIIFLLVKILLLKLLV